MEIVGLGTEIVECARIRASIAEHAEKFLHRVYTEEEIRWCQSRSNSTEQFAVLWAAKEAVFKCLQIVGRAGTPWSQIEIEIKGDMPRVKLRGPLRDRMAAAGIGNILLTSAYTRHYATATAIALRSGIA